MLLDVAVKPPPMSRQALRIIIFVVVLGLSWMLKQQHPPSTPRSAGEPSSAKTTSPGDRICPASETWGHLDSLPDHFARHGADFNARNAEDYAAQAAAFLQRAKTSGLSAKRSADGSLRIYDRGTDTFGAYNANGTTRTFFKPGSPGYFERQPGMPLDLRAEK
jgi:hypothetical protein